MSLEALISFIEEFAGKTEIERLNSLFNNLSYVAYNSINVELLKKGNFIYLYYNPEWLGATIKENRKPFIITKNSLLALLKKANQLNDCYSRVIIERDNEKIKLYGTNEEPS